MITVVSRGADLSPCQSYRYQLTRALPAGEGVCVFVMLNPSTADGLQDDATIRRCLGFTHAWGFRELRVVNLFAWRATLPRDMLKQVDPVGPDGDGWILRATADAARIIAAWGAHSSPTVRRRADHVRALMLQHGRAVHHLGLSKAGHPKHPLFLENSTCPTRWY
jgi:hypothetical protein